MLRENNSAIKSALVSLLVGRVIISRDLNIMMNKSIFKSFRNVPAQAYLAVVGGTLILISLALDFSYGMQNQLRFYYNLIKPFSIQLI